MSRTLSNSSERSIEAKSTSKVNTLAKIDAVVKETTESDDYESNSVQKSNSRKSTKSEPQLEPYLDINYMNGVTEAVEIELE